jgi:hypothetical protein
VKETKGEVLCQLGVRNEELGVKDYEICDARFYKCCGGVTEEFETCWEDTHFDYLVKVEDNDANRSLSLSKGPKTQAQ